MSTTDDRTRDREATMSESENIDWDSVEADDFNIEQPQDDAENTPSPGSGGDVGWPAVWDSCNLPHDAELSPTQIAGAIEVADATGGAGRDDQARLCQEALDSDALHVRRTVAHTDDETNTLVIAGYTLPAEVRDV
jgi:hypothetical protein